MSKCRRFFAGLMLAQVGVCAGRILALYLDFHQRPGLYETFSAPWYTGAHWTLLITAVLMAATALVGHLLARISEYRNAQSLPFDQHQEG